ncbi:MAG: hypothetical protein JO211_00770 [Acidobacteriaceae bacterium]|nr:hypothetical protein [Acidobacteriaceae bacterium]
MRVTHILRDLCTQPHELLVKRWNWKAALLSSIFRALIFFTANLAAGWRAACGALLAEFAYRSVTSGFYGAMTQAFREAEPAWLASTVAVVLLPLLSHSLELGVHLLRGTPKLLTSFVSSVCFTCISTMFNLYAMRRGALVVCSGAGSLASDLRRVPALIAGFLAAGPLMIWRCIRRSLSVTQTAAPSPARFNLPTDANCYSSSSNAYSPKS